MSLRKIGRAGAALLLASAILTACGGSEGRQTEYLNRAQSYFDAQNYEKAKIEVKNVLQINPNNADARYLAGMIAEKEKNLRGAFSNYSAAVQANPKHVKSLDKLAGFFIAAGNLDEASKRLDEALEADPKDANSIALKGVVYARQGKTDEAVIQAQKALSIDPGNVDATGLLTSIYAKDNPELAMEVITKGIANQTENESLKVMKLRLLISQKKRAEAVSLYKELIAEHPDQLFYTAQLVNYYLQDDSVSEDARKDLAEKTLRDLVASKPDEEQPKLWLSEFVLKNRSPEKAVDLLKGYVKDYPDMDKLRDGLASIYLRTKKYDSAKNLFQSLIDADPTGSKAIKARDKLIAIALAQNEEDKAKELLAEVFKLDPENAFALLTRAKLSLKENKIDDAIPDLRIVLKNDPESKEALALLAAAYESKGSDDLALDNYQRLLGLQPKNVPAMIGAAKILVKKNELDKALPLVESAALINGSNPEVAKLLTDLYSREQRWDDALAASTPLLDSSDKKAKALGNYLQGRVYLRQKEFNKALSSLKTSLEQEPSGIETLSSIAAAYLALEQPDNALKFVEGYVKKHPDLVHAQELLATLYARQRNTDKAIEIAKSILKGHPDRVSTYTLLGRLYIASSKVDKAEEMYLDGIGKNPEQVLLRFSLAEIYQTTGKADKAIHQYEEALKVQPDSLVAKNNLASLLLDSDSSPATLQRVMGLSEDLAATENPAFLDTAGWVQYKLGNYAQAVSMLGAAVQNGGKAPVYHYHLGMAYFKSDLKDQAKEQLKLALKDDNAKFVGKDEAQETLKSL